MIIRISNSMLSALARCETLAFLRTYNYGSTDKEKFGESAAPLVAGGSVHLAHEKWASGATDQESIQTFLSDYTPFSEEFLLPKTGRYHENIEKVLEVYFDNNPLKDMPFRIIETEKPIEIELLNENGNSLVLTDKSDNIVEMKSDGSLYSLELKTTTTIDKSWADKWRMDPQVSSHYYVTKLQGYDIKGIILEGIQLRKPPEAVDRKCAEHKIAQKDCWQAHVKFTRLIETRTPEQIENWQRQALAGLREYANILLQTKGNIANLSDVGQRGFYTNSCPSCEFNDFCYSQRKNFNLIEQKPAKIIKGVVRSGIYNE